MKNIGCTGDGPLGKGKGIGIVEPLAAQFRFNKSKILGVGYLEQEMKNPFLDPVPKMVIPPPPPWCGYLKKRMSTTKKQPILRM